MLKKNNSTFIIKYKNFNFEIIKIVFKINNNIKKIILENFKYSFIIKLEF